jgi:beta-glucosidase
MDMGSAAYTSEGEALYREDPAFAAAVDEAVRRILCVKLALGLFEHPHRRAFPDRIAEDKDARALAREVARHCMVLLKNGAAQKMPLPLGGGETGADDTAAQKKTLPLNGSEKLFLTGPLADDEADMPGAWAGYRPDTNVYSVKKAVEEAGIPFDSFAGCPFRGKYCFDDTDESDFAEGLRRAAACDVIVFVCGERAPWSGENRGRVSITLPQLQIRYLRELKKTGKPIVSVLMCGRAMACAELVQLSDALLLAWHAGTEAGHAVCDCLYGLHDPCGRLPITFPYYTGQIPYYHSWLSSGRDRNALIRYKDGENGPLFPFGYGLSYADVAYRSVEIPDPALASDKDELRVRVVLENRSDVPTYEVVQAYFQDVVSSLAAPERKLCGFAKVFVPAHGTAEAELSIPAARFALMTKDLREVVEPGEFRLFVGHDSACTEERRFTVGV